MMQAAALEREPNIAPDLRQRPPQFGFDEIDEIGEIPRIVAVIDARQAEAQVGLWRAGDQGFDALLRANLPPAKALRRLAIGHWSAGNPRSASAMLATAASIAPELAEVWLDLGFTLQRIGEKRDAKLAIERSLVLDPARAAAWLGLALLANELGDKALAERAFAAALERDRSLSDASFGLGLIAFEQRRYLEAVERFRAAVAAGCDNSLVKVGLGQSLFFIGDFAGAARELRGVAAGSSDPALVRRSALAHYLERAVAGDFAAAERVYAEIAGSHAEESLALAKSAFQILSAYGHREAAMKLADARLDGGAGDPVQRYLIDAVAGKPLQRAPKDYLIANFDHFADQFDKQLVEVLGYNVPEKLGEMIDATGRRLNRVVDLGCGTGLAGLRLREGERSRLVGVDLSTRMLAKSAARGVYDELVEADIVTFLRDTRECFDLVMAADVLIYFGGLQSFFAAAARVTTVGAILAFNVETTTEAPFRVLPSGRFAHDLSALPNMAAPWFTIFASRINSTRSEAGRQVEGALALMERCDGPPCAANADQVPDDGASRPGGARWAAAA